MVAISRGSKSGRISPLLGEPFLTSAMTAVQPDRAASRRARSNPRGWSSRSASLALISESGWLAFAAATSPTLWATIVLRMSGVLIVSLVNQAQVKDLNLTLLVRHRGQPLKLLQGTAGIDRLFRDDDSFLERSRLPCRDKRESGVDQYYVPAGAGFAGKDRFYNNRILFGIPPLQPFHGTEVEAEFFGSKEPDAHSGRCDLGDACSRSQRHLIHAVHAMDDETVLAAKLVQDVGELFDQRFSINTHNLALCSGRIGERTENVEDGTYPYLPSRSDGMFHGTMQGRRKQETDADLRNALLDFLRSNFKIYPELFKNIGAAAK